MDSLKRGSSIFHVAIRFIRATQQIWPILLSWIIGYNSPSIFVWSLSVLPPPPLFYVVACAVVAFLALGYTFFRKKTQVRQGETTDAVYDLRWEPKRIPEENRFRNLVPALDFDALDTELDTILNGEDLSKAIFESSLNLYSESIRESFEQSLHSRNTLSNYEELLIDEIEVGMASEMPPRDLVGRWVYVESHGPGRVVAFNRVYMPGTGDSRHVIDFKGEHKLVVLRRTKYLVLVNGGLRFCLIDPPSNRVRSEEETISKIQSSQHEHPIALISAARTATASPPPPLSPSEESHPNSQSQEELQPSNRSTPDTTRRCFTSFDDMRQAKALPLLGEFRTKMLGDPNSLSSAQKHFLSDETLLRYLRAADGDLTGAAASLTATLKWRAENIDPALETPPSITSLEHSEALPDIGEVASRLRCPACQQDACSHCFFRLGKDVSGREVIYSCAGRSRNKVVEDNVTHMSYELERIFGGGSQPGKMAWIIDFNGFSLSDCSPRMGALSIPMFVKHYPERLGEILLLDPPLLFFGLYKTVLPLLDQVTRQKVRFLRGSKTQEVYSAMEWEPSDQAMASWIRAIRNVPGRPGMFPPAALTQALSDTVTREKILRAEVS